MTYTMSEVNPQKTVPEVPLESTPEGEGDDASRISLEKLNEHLGRDYKDVDTALDAVKETYSFVGKRDELRQGLEKVIEATGADESTVLEKLQNLMSNPEEAKIEAQVETPQSDDMVTELQRQMLQERQQYAEDRFFDKNPGYETVKDVIKPLKNTSDFKDMSWDEFKDTDTVKSVFEAYTAAQEAQSKKSVVESNPRIGAATDKLNTAREAMQNNNDVAAKENAVGAVVDLITD